MIDTCMMTDAARTEALDRAHHIYQDPDAAHGDTLLAVALLEATEQIHAFEAAR